MNKVSLCVLAVLSAAAAVSCGARETVPLAFIGSLSGKLTANSTLGMNAVELYLGGPEAAKSRARYELVTYDDRSDAASLDGIVADILRRGIRFVIGPLPSAFAKKVRDLTSGERLLQIGPIASADVLAGGDDNFIKMYPSVRESADKLAEHARTLGLRKIAPIQDLANKDFDDIWLGSFAAILGGSVEIAPPVSFTNPADLNYARIADEALATGADAALLVTNTFDGATLCQLLRKKAPSIVLLFSSWSFNAEFLASTGRSSEGALFAAAFDNASRAERYLKFREDYKARYLKDVDEYAPAYCYESIMVLDRAINAARSTDPARVKEAIIRIGKFEGLQGDFSIDRYGDARREALIIAVRNGAYRALR